MAGAGAAGGAAGFLASWASKDIPAAAARAAESAPVTILLFQLLFISITAVLLAIFEPPSIGVARPSANSAPLTIPGASRKLRARVSRAPRPRAHVPPDRGRRDGDGSPGRPPR